MTTTAPILAFAIGTLTTQGVFTGMHNKNLACFVKDCGNGKSFPIICSPKLAKPITQEEYDERLAAESAWKAKGFWGQATVLTGDAARAALSTLA